MLFSGNGFVRTYSQNLIINPSFEQFDSCTNYVGNVNVVHNWGNANQTTPDYYNSCNTGLVSIPTNHTGYQYAQEGNAYVGFVMDDIIQTRESVQGLISQPLQAGKYYCFEMYINIADTVSYVINQLGIYFDDDTIIAANYTYNNNSLTPQLIINVEGVTDTSAWTLVTGGYYAYGGEKHFVIAGFNNLIWTQYRFDSVGTNEKITYYNIDNLNLYECPPPPIIPPIIPNVMSPNDDGLNDVFFIQYLPQGCIVKIYTRWGEIIYESTDYQNDWKGTNTSGQTITDGTYFYILQTPDGKSYTGTLNSFGK